MEVMKKVVLLAFLVLGTGAQLLAQDLFYRKNLANVRVDNLSQDQVIRFQQQIQGSNMSGQEMETYLRSKGLSREEIAKLKKRMGTLGNTDAAKDFYNIELMNDYFKLRDSLKQTGWDPDAPDAAKSRYAKSPEVADSIIFGSELFSNSKFSFTPDIPVASPVNYILGPGDVITMTIYGAHEQNTDIKITPEGRATIPYAGVLSLSGLTIEQATTRIRQALERNGYASLGTGETKIQLTIGEFRSFQVTVIGAKNSGIYLVPSIATALQVLHAAGGPSKNGTYREIEIIRKGKIIQKIDLYDFMVSGNLTQNITLKENDVINIPAYDKRVQLKGEVKRTGLFEVMPGENFGKLLKYSGGFTAIAFRDRIYVEYITDNEFGTRDIMASGFDSYEPSAGDVIMVGSILNRYVNRVSVAGAVMRPGYYGWSEEMTLKTLLDKAGGFKESALMSRGLVYRATRENDRYYLQFNPEKVLNGSEALQLEDGDSVIIGDRALIFLAEHIQVMGEVHQPGKYVFGEGITALDAVLLAGGMRLGAMPNRIEIARRNDGRGNQPTSRIIEAESDRELMMKAEEVKLSPMDVVIIRPNPEFRDQVVVSLEGEFVYPGPYVLKKQWEKLSEVIERAGGPTVMADMNAAFIIREMKNPLFMKRMKEVETKEIRFSNKSEETMSRSDFGNIDQTDLDSIILDTIVVDLKALMGKNGERYDLLLRNGDILQLPVRRNTISVRGEVNNKLTINYVGKKMKPYLRDAGGTSKYADKKRIYVIEPSGRAKATKQFMGIRSYPHVSPGSTVVVPPKITKENGGIDPARTAAISSAIASTTGLLFLLATILR
jgi:protein involved in polysaccharide export with SLBB domain